MAQDAQAWRFSAGDKLTQQQHSVRVCGGERPNVICWAGQGEPGTAPRQGNVSSACILLAWVVQAYWGHIRRLCPTEAHAGAVTSARQTRLAEHPHRFTCTPLPQRGWRQYPPAQWHTQF